MTDDQSPANATGGKESKGQAVRWADLSTRLISAGVLLIVTSLAVLANGPLFAIVVSIVFAGIYREWEVMVRGPELTAGSYFLTGLIAIIPLGAVSVGGAVAWPIAGFALIFALLSNREAKFWRVLGIIFITMVIVAISALRGEGSPGFAACFFLGATVWMTDTGAFFVGRQLGGAKLNPGISPGKTWAGAIGGWVIGTASGLLFWIVMTPSPIWIGFLVAGAISFSGQIGDLAESAIKRRFHLKDSGDVIPGHGGFMDRLDSLTFGALLAFVIGFLHAGADMVPAGLLLW